MKKREQLRRIEAAMKKRELLRRIEALEAQAAKGVIPLPDGWFEYCAAGRDDCKDKREVTPPAS